jgi:hypothetical protein
MRLGNNLWCLFYFFRRRLFQKTCPKNGQSRETGNIGYTRQRKTKQKHNTICVGHDYM